MMVKKFISIVTPCYNEEGNVQELYNRIKTIMAFLTDYTYEHIFIDNASQDNTVAILRQMAKEDKNVKVILNTRNFGYVRSPNYALLQARGEAVILIVADLQDPPELIKDFLKKWEEGFKIVIGIKEKSEESRIFFTIRKFYYNLIGKLSDIDLIKNYTGFGLYDQKIIQILKKIDDPYPYFRGIICDIGYERSEIFYTQPTRRRGVTKSNFFALYDVAMLGITNHSKVPLRLATMSGFAMAFLSLLVAIGYFFYKLLYWYSFNIGIAPLVIGLFFFGSVQLIFIGIIGEYIGSIHTQVLKRPLVIEKERINFDSLK